MGSATSPQGIPNEVAAETGRIRPGSGYSLGKGKRTCFFTIPAERVGDISLAFRSMGPWPGEPTRDRPIEDHLESSPSPISLPPEPVRKTLHTLSGHHFSTVPTGLC